MAILLISHPPPPASCHGRCAQPRSPIAMFAPAAKLIPHVRALAEDASDETLEAGLQALGRFMSVCGAQDWRHLSALCSADLSLVRAYRRLLRARLDHYYEMQQGRTDIVCALLFEVQDVSRWQAVLPVPQTVRKQVRTRLRSLQDVRDAHVSRAAILFAKNELQAFPEPTLMAAAHATLGGVRLPFALPEALPLAESVPATIAVFVALEREDAAPAEVHAGAVMDETLGYQCEWPGLHDAPLSAEVAYAWQATYAIGRAFAGDMGDEFVDDLLSASYPRGVQREVVLYCVPSRTFDEVVRARSYEVTADLCGEGRRLNRYEFGPTFAPAFLLGHLVAALEPYPFSVQLLHDRPEPLGLAS